MASATVRTPSREELTQAAKVAQIAFESEKIDSWINSYNWVADNFGIEYTIVVETGGEIVASMLCTPGQARFGDDVVPLSAVGGVATLPEFRKLGFAGLMMEESVRILSRNGQHTAGLWPFSYAYYRKYGWELASEGRAYTIPSKTIAQLWKPEGTRPALQQDLPAISALVDRFAVSHSCTSIRDRLWWDFMTMIRCFKFDGNEDPKCCKYPSPWVHETDGTIDGYAMFEIEGEGKQAQIKIDELVFENPIARQAILSRMASTGLKNITLFAPIDDGLLHELLDPRAVKAGVHPGFQFRVINPLGAMEMRRVDPEIAGQIGFDITDPVLGMAEFDVEFANGYISRANSRAQQRLSMDVQTFSQLYSGYLRPTRAAALGRISPSSDESLRSAERLFPDIVPYRSLVELG